MTDKPRRGNPNMQPGAPSVNPRGSGVSKTTLELATAIATSGADIAKQLTEVSKKAAPGTNGVWAPGGYLYNSERDRKLQGTQKWVTQDNLIANVAIVAAAVNIWLTLAGSVKWKATPNKRGGRNANKCADLVQEGLIDARMPERWRAVVRRQAMKKFRGAAMHAKGWRRDSMGRHVFAELAHRPMWSIDKWLQRSEGEPWYAVVQRTRSGMTTTPIAREDLFVSVEGAISDDFAGLGLLRHLVKLGDTLEGFETLERIGFDNDMRGLPVGRAPLAKLARDAVQFGGVAADDTAGIAAYVNAQVSFLRDLLEKHIVKPDRSILLDSSPHRAETSDGSDRLSSIFEWSIDTVKSTMSGMPELGAAYARVTQHMAIVLCCEHMLLGGADAGGAYAMHGDKTQMFGLNVEGVMDDVQDDAERDLVWPMCARNGYNPETDAPTLEHEPIPTQSIESAAKSLVLIRQAALRPGDKAGDMLRGRMGLPEEPELDPALLLAPRGRVPEINSLPGAKPDDNSKQPTAEQTDDPDKLPEGDA